MNLFTRTSHMGQMKHTKAALQTALLASRIERGTTAATLPQSSASVRQRWAAGALACEVGAAAG